MPKIKDTRMFMPVNHPRKYRDQIDEIEDHGRRNRKTLADVETEEYFEQIVEIEAPAEVVVKKRGRPRKTDVSGTQNPLQEKRVEEKKKTITQKRTEYPEKSKGEKCVTNIKKPNNDERAGNLEKTNPEKRVIVAEKTTLNERVKSTKKPNIDERATDIKKTNSLKLHAKFGSPSMLKRTKECPSWITFGRNIPEPEQSEHAEEGDTFHDFMERCSPEYLSGNDKKVALILKECTKYEDMETHVWDALAKLKNIWERFREKHAACKYHFELQVKLSEDCFGTSDVVFIGKNIKTQKMSILTIDWKYGLGVYVKAEENLQGIAYLLGAANTLGINHSDIGIGMIIIGQVRLNDDWEKENFIVKGEEFGRREKEILAIVERAKLINFNSTPAIVQNGLKAGEHCRFCKCQPVCPTAKEASIGALTIAAQELPIEDVSIEDQVKALTLSEQIGIFLKKSYIEDFLKAVASNLQNAFESGVTDPALKLVRTNGRRAWRKDVDIEELGAELIEIGVIDPWAKKLKGLTEIEREIGKGKIDELVEVGEGKIELVRADDKRQAIQIAQAEELPA